MVTLVISLCLVILLLALLALHYRKLFLRTVVPAHLFSPEQQKNLTPDQAIDALKKGNQHFLDGDFRSFDYLHIKEYILEHGQSPIAVIVGCMDSRSVPEILMDKGIGNLFAIRIAGNVVDKDALASIEYGVKSIGVKVVVIMGHTGCGAVTAAYQGKHYGNLEQLLNKITPAVLTAKAQNPELEESELITQVAIENINNQIIYIKQHSDIVKNAIEKQEIKLIGALHDVKTGKIDFFT